MINKIKKWWYSSSGVRSVGCREAYVYRYKGKYHRENGPAIIFNDGSYEYYKHGVLHREDGPAYFSSFILGCRTLSNNKQFFVPFKYFYNGKEIICENTEEFKKKIKLLAFI